MNETVAAAFAAYPPKLKGRRMLLRQWILDVAAQTGGVGPLDDDGDKIPVEVLSHCISAALAYHLRKPRAQRHRHRV